MTWLLFGRSVITAVITWLSHRSFWQVVSLILAIILIVQTLRLGSEQRHASKLQAQVVKLSNELTRISSVKNEQKIITRDRIVTVNRGLQAADERARKVEQAPPAPNCKTKPEVLQADL